MLMNNTNKKVIHNSDTTYKPTNYLYTQPKLFNLIKACKKKGFKFALYTLFIPLFFFDFYKEYILSADIVFLSALIVLTYIIKPAVNNNFIKKVSYHTEFKIETLSKAMTLMISSIYRLLFATISQIGNMYFYNTGFDINLNSTIILITSGISIIIICMFLFPANLNVENNHQKMYLNYKNLIDQENNKTQINNYHKELKNQYKAQKYNTFKGSNSTTNNTQPTKTIKTSNNPKIKTEQPVKKSDRRRRIF